MLWGNFLTERTKEARMGRRSPVPQGVIYEKNSFRLSRRRTHVYNYFIFKRKDRLLFFIRFHYVNAHSHSDLSPGVN